MGTLYSHRYFQEDWRLIIASCVGLVIVYRTVMSCDGNTHQHITMLSLIHAITNLVACHRPTRQSIGLFFSQKHGVGSVMVESYLCSSFYLPYLAIPVPRMSFSFFVHYSHAFHPSAIPTPALSDTGTCITPFGESHRGVTDSHGGKSTPKNWFSLSADPGTILVAISETASRRV